ncbi:hypothetical protein Tco_0584972 [Tanacetum coccineum]
MWKPIQRLMQGTEINQQEMETKLVHELDMFKSIPGDSLESYTFTEMKPKMYAEMLTNQQLHKKDPCLFEALRNGIEKDRVGTNTCRKDEIQNRTHNDHLDDRPEGENANMRKTTDKPSSITEPKTSKPPIQNPPPTSSKQPNQHKTAKTSSSD